jgi:uncharacterized protein YcfL
MKKVLYLTIIMFLLTGCNQEVAASKDLFYMDTYININGWIL